MSTSSEQPPLGDDYEVGYRRPPKAHQFKKGQSGNPRGRKKGSKGLRTLVQQEFAKFITINVGGRSKKMPALQVLLRRLISNAIKGDRGAAIQLFRLMERYDLPERNPDDDWDLSRLSNDQFDQFDHLLKLCIRDQE